LCGENGVDDIGAFEGDDVMVSWMDLFDEIVSAKHAQQARDAGPAPTLFLFGLGGVVVEDALQVAVTKPIDGELSPHDSLEQARVLLGPWPISANPLAVVSSGHADVMKHLTKRGGCVDRNQADSVHHPCQPFPTVEADLDIYPVGASQNTLRFTNFLGS
jgi:hypothetical protein